MVSRAFASNPKSRKTPQGLFYKDCATGFPVVALQNALENGSWSLNPDFSRRLSDNS